MTAPAPALEDVRLRLEGAVQAGIEALMAFELALERTDAAGLYARLHAFRLDHRRHVTELTQAMAQLGLPIVSEDEPGRFFQDYTALRLQLGEEASLRGLCAVTRRTVAAYDSCLAQNLPAELRELVAAHAGRVLDQLAELQDVLAAHA